MQEDIGIDHRITGYKRFALEKEPDDQTHERDITRISHLLDMLYLSGEIDLSNDSPLPMRLAQVFSLLTSRRKKSSSEGAISRHFKPAREIYRSDLDRLLAEGDKISENIRDQVKTHLEYIAEEHRKTTEVFNGIRKGFPAAKIERDLGIRQIYATDSSNLHVELPMGVFVPESTEDVIKMVKLANQLDFCIVPRGGGVGFTGGCVPITPRTLVMSMERMNGVDEVVRDEKGTHITTQAGAITEDVDKKAGKTGAMFAVDPVSKKASTVGGNLAEGAGGPHCFEYGAAIDNVLGFEFVDPQGDLYIIERTAPLPATGRIRGDQELVFKITPGEKEIRLPATEIRRPGLAKDVMNKYLGGLPGAQKEGTDGIITQIHWALHEKPPRRETFFIEAEDFEEGHQLVMKMIEARDRHGDNSVRIMRLEHWDKTCGGLTDQTQPAPESSFAIEVGATDQSLIDEIATVCETGASSTLRVSRNPPKSPWDFRNQIKRISKKTGVKLNEDIAINPTLWPKFNQFVYTLREQYAQRWTSIRDEATTKYTGDQTFADSEFVIAFFGHYGDGNAHFTIPIYLQYPEMVDLAEECVEELFEAILKPEAEDGFGGSITGEHGIGLAKIKFLKQMQAKSSAVAETELAKLRAYQTMHKTPMDPGEAIHPGLDPDQEVALYTPNNFGFIDALRRHIEHLRTYIAEDPRRAETMTYTPEIFETMLEISDRIKGCVRCGACKEACHEHMPDEDRYMSPYYKNTMLQTMLVLIAEHMMHDPRHAVPQELWTSLKRVADACSGCDNCKPACTSDISTKTTVEEVKRLMHTVSERDFLVVPPTPKDFTAALLSSPIGKKVVGLGMKIAGFLPRRLTRDTPMLLEGPVNPLSHVRGVKNGAILRGTEEDTLVFLWQGCGEIAGKTALANIYLAHQIGQSVIMTSPDRCCGFPEEFQRGERVQAIQKANREALTGIGMAQQGQQIDTVLANCPSCQVALRETVEGTALHIQDFMTTIFARLQPAQITTLQEKLRGKRVGFQTPCHIEDSALRAYRQFFARVSATFIETGVCCGSVGGSCNGTRRFEARSGRLAEIMKEVSVATSSCTICTGSANHALEGREQIDIATLPVIIAETLGGKGWENEAIRVLRQKASGF